MEDPQKSAAADAGWPALLAGMHSDIMCLSEHWRFGLGSISKDYREKALTVMRHAVDFAAEFGLRIVHVAGCDVHYEPSNKKTRRLFLDAILQSAQQA